MFFKSLLITGGLDRQPFALYTSQTSLNWKYASLKKNGFESELVKKMKILIKNPESCVTNDGKTTQYFNKLERGTWQRDSISAYLFMLALLELIFALIYAKPAVL